MPHLPLDRPEPFAATFGVMLYPGLDKRSREDADAAAGLITSNAIRLAVAAGHQPHQQTLLDTHKLGLDPLFDFDKCVREGYLAGTLFISLFTLYNSDPSLASWNNAIKTLSNVRVHQGTAFSGKFYKKIRKRYETALHLWAAWILRGQTLRSCDELDFEAYDDFDLFLFEAECLRQWGQTWVPGRAGAKPPLVDDVWRPPSSWIPPERGILRHPEYPCEVLRTLRTAGRPRKSA